jgi:hypothetical protein
MKNTFIQSIILLLLILALGLYLAPFIPKVEGFRDYLKIPLEGKYPISVYQAILDSYPLIGKNITIDNTYNKIWWRYPTFTEGSYAQLTNNLKYWINPDEGICIRADFCGAVYHNNKNTKSNKIYPLPPAQEGPGARVGYFRTEPNLLYYSIPTNENILY